MRGRTVVATFSLTLLGAGCSTGDGAPTVTNSPAGSAGTTQAVWPSGSTCRERLDRLLALPATARERLDPAASPFAREVQEAAGASELEVDLPIPPASGRADEAACVLQIALGQPEPGAPPTVIGTRIVQSSYRREGRRRVNPEHEELRELSRDLESRKGRPRILATGDPGIDLIGLLAETVLEGIDEVQRRMARGEVEAALANTPRHLETVLWEPYTYPASEVLAARGMPVRVTLSEATEPDRWQAAGVLREERTFQVAQRRHRKDKDLLEGDETAVTSEAEVLAWQQRPMRPKLSAVAALLLQGQPAPEPAAGPRPLLPPEAQRRLQPAGLRLLTPEGPMTATLMPDGKVAVPLAATGRSGVVTLIDGEGRRSYGIVESRDAAAGRAIVRVGAARPREALKGAGAAAPMR